MRRITTFRSTRDRIYDGGPIILQYNIIILTIVLIACSIQYSNMLRCAVGYTIKVCVSTLYDVATTTKSPNDAFLRTYPRR